MSNHFAIAIFAGGQSRRMGSDKPQLLWNGVPMLQHTCATALAVADRVLVVGREHPHDWPFEQVQFLCDDMPDLGPIGGLQTVLDFARREDIAQIFALACDLPLIDERALCWLIEQARQRELFHGLVTERDGELEPLFSVYTPSCSPLIHYQLAQQKRSMRGLIQNGDFEYVEAPPEIARCLHNVNTTEDWAQAQQLSPIGEII